MPQNKNKDLSPHFLTEQQYAPLDLQRFYNKDVKVFWVDGQKIEEDLTYTFDADAMPLYAPAHIPIVCRFLYTFDESDGDKDDMDAEAEKQSNDCGGDTGTGEPACPALDTLPIQEINFLYITEYSGGGGAFPNNVCNVIAKVYQYREDFFPYDPITPASLIATMSLRAYISVMEANGWPSAMFFHADYSCCDIPVPPAPPEIEGCGE
jgi:hypothetical protein